MKTYCSLLAGLGFIAVANAHMELNWPPPFRSKFNPYTTDIDYSMTSPLNQDGSNYPCKGYHELYDTPQGQAVVNWQAGQSYNFSLVGSATHNGGSCQASLSFDRGSSWTVIYSYIGNCPLTPVWDFAIPNDTPAGDALFAWSWFNNIGNREMYMNCAHVTINGGSRVEQRSPSDPISSRPGIFVANVGNGCTTLEGSDVLFPQLGPDVDNTSGKTAPPIGNCGGASKRVAQPLRV